MSAPTVVQGATDLVLKVAQGAGLIVTLTCTAFGDMTGWHAHSQFRDNQAGDLLADLRDTGGIAIDGPNSKLQLILTGAQTAEFPATGGIWDLFVQAPSSEPTLLVGGSVVVRMSVTVPAI